MEHFSYVWFFTVFILQILGVGIGMARLDKENETKKYLFALFLNVIKCIFTGLALYMWK